MRSLSVISSGTHHIITSERLLSRKTFPEIGIPLKRFVVPYGDGKRFLRADEDDELLSPRHRGIDEVSLKKEVVLRQDRHDDNRILAAL